MGDKVDWMDLIGEANHRYANLRRSSFLSRQMRCPCSVPATGQNVTHINQCLQGAWTALR